MKPPPLQPKVQSLFIDKEGIRKEKKHHSHSEVSSSLFRSKVITMAGTRGNAGVGKGKLAAGLCLLRPSPPPPRRARRSSAPRKAPLSRRGGDACSSPARSLRGAGGTLTRPNAAGDSLGVDNRGETETRGSDGSIESPPESRSEVDRTPVRSLVQRAAEETDKGAQRNSRAQAQAPRAGDAPGSLLLGSLFPGGLEISHVAAAAATATMNKAAGRDELAELFSLIPDLLQVTNTSGNASQQLQGLWWELGLELQDGAAPGHLPGGGGAESADTEARVRILISVVYWVVCALGLTGNLLVLYLMKSKQGWRKSSINFFVTNLALTDFQFVLTLPFWAVENALDFKWPFGKAMCKIVSTVTSMNMYASVFFLTSMSVARYHSVASALKSHRTRGHGRGDCCGRSLGDSCCFSVKALCLLIWALATLASLPNAIFSTTIEVMGEELCLMRFPDQLLGRDRQFWLGLYHLQKVLLGFVLPLGIISLCYLLLVRFISDHRVAGTEGGASAARGGLAGASARRRSKVTKSVTIVVLSFFLCWLPNQALTTWSILIKFSAVPFSQEYFLCQVYAFPVSVCLAHSNSCLNPILYCLVRREFRKALKNLLWRIASPSLTSMRPFTATTKPEPEDQGLQALAPLHRAAEPDLLYYPPGVVVYSGGRYDLLPSSSAY
ncbi:relaxin-3 receptor 1 [Hippopotamus amphibius kiboko]|uniref:relaxin-3 receptor 1 n=1 Tax=Hippopotamus amphibius kiboko TaxID=575201 RepID=UPI002598F6AD|nr:relaxin-3 receptor 1 [Hippopotamus amphibius kiboko]